MEMKLGRELCKASSAAKDPKKQVADLLEAMAAPPSLTRFLEEGDPDAVKAALHFLGPNGKERKESAQKNPQHKYSLEKLKEHMKNPVLAFFWRKFRVHYFEIIKWCSLNPKEQEKWEKCATLRDEMI